MMSHWAIPEESAIYRKGGPQFTVLSLSIMYLAQKAEIANSPRRTAQTGGSVSLQHSFPDGRNGMKLSDSTNYLRTKAVRENLKESQKAGKES